MLNDLQIKFIPFLFEHLLLKFSFIFSWTNNSKISFIFEKIIQFKYFSSKYPIKITFH
jgi:hypothetical protein